MTPRANARVAGATFLHRDLGFAVPVARPPQPATAGPAGRLAR